MANSGDKVLDWQELKEMFQGFLEPPIFSGKDPEEWLQRIETYFRFNGTPPNQLFSVVQKSMDASLSGKYWFELISEIFPCLTWSEFKKHFMERFGSPEIQKEEQMQEGAETDTDEATVSDSKNGEDNDSENRFGSAQDDKLIVVQEQTVVANELASATVIGLIGEEHMSKIIESHSEEFRLPVMVYEGSSNMRKIVDIDVKVRDNSRSREEELESLVLEVSLRSGTQIQFGEVIKKEMFLQQLQGVPSSKQRAASHIFRTTYGMAFVHSKPPYTDTGQVLAIAKKIVCFQSIKIGLFSICDDDPITEFSSTWSDEEGDEVLEALRTEIQSVHSTKIIEVSGRRPLRMVCDKGWRSSFLIVPITHMCSKYVNNWKLIGPITHMCSKYIGLENQNKGRFLLSSTKGGDVCNEGSTNYMPFLEENTRTAFWVALHMSIFSKATWISFYENTGPAFKIRRSMGGFCQRKWDPIYEDTWNLVKNLFEYEVVQSLIKRRGSFAEFSMPLILNSTQGSINYYCSKVEEVAKWEGEPICETLSKGRKGDKFRCVVVKCFIFILCTWNHRSVPMKLCEIQRMTEFDDHYGVGRAFGGKEARPISWNACHLEVSISFPWLIPWMTRCWLESFGKLNFHTNAIIQMQS